MLGDIQSRNKAFYERGVELMKQERLIHKMLEIDDQLKELQKIELEAKIVKECAIIEKSRELGILVSSNDDYIHMEPIITYMWQAHTQKNPQHHCGKSKEFFCMKCGLSNGKKTVEAFLLERLEVSEQDQFRHHCTITDLKFFSGCTFFSLPKGVNVALPSNPTQIVNSQQIWFICMETGNMHHCGKDRCSSVKINRYSNNTPSCSCDISGYAKALPYDDWQPWDGQTFYSVERLQTIRNSHEKQTNDAFNFEDVDEDAHMFGHEEIFETIAENPNPSLKKGTSANSLTENVKDPQENVPDETAVNQKKRKSESEEREEEDPVPLVEDDEEYDNTEDDEVSDTEHSNPSAKVNQSPKRQKISEFVSGKKNTNLENPLQKLRSSVGDGITLQELAYQLAKDELEEEEKLRELRRQQEEQNAARQMRFSFSTGNREMRRLVLRLNGEIRSHHQTMKSREEGPKKRASKREERMLTSEEKTAQFLARSDVDAATTIVKRLLDAGVKNGIAKYRLNNALDVADLALAKLEMESDYGLTQMAYRSLWCSRISKIVGCTLFNEYVDINVDRFVHIIMIHWEEASKTPLVTKILDKHKKKKHKPLDFMLYCIGILYTMANGGAFVNVKISESLPPSLLTLDPKFSKIITQGFFIPELPDESKTLGHLILKPEFIRHLASVYKDDKQFTNEIYQESLQAVRQCYESRHRQEQEQFLQEIREAEQADQLTFPNAKKIYAAYLARLKPPHLRVQAPCPTSILPPVKSS